MADTVVKKTRRNYTQERATALHKLVGGFADIAEAAQLQPLPKLQITQALLLCGLPYSPHHEADLTREARLGDGSTLTVTYHAHDFARGVGLPYGADRTLLHFLIDRAIGAQSQWINWTTAMEYLDTFGMARSGENAKDLKTRIQRIQGLSLTVRRTTEQAVEMVRIPVIRRSRLPRGLSVASEKQMVLPGTGIERFGMELDSGLYQEFALHPIPMPKAILIETRNKPALQDAVLFLQYRTYIAQSESLVPWDRLHMQYGSTGQLDRRARYRQRETFRTAAELLKRNWTQGAFPIEVTPDGIIVSPAAAGIDPDATKRKRRTGKTS